MDKGDIALTVFIALVILLAIASATFFTVTTLNDNADKEDLCKDNGMKYGGRTINDAGYCYKAVGDKIIETVEIRRVFTDFYLEAKE